MILKKFNDLITPLENSWRSNRFKDIPCKSNITMKISKSKVITSFDNDIDNMFLYAIREYDNLNTILLIGLDKRKSYDLYNKEFSKDFILFGIKEFSIKVSLFIKILYQSLYLKYDIDDYQTLIDKLKEITYLSSITENLSKLDNKIKISILVTCSRTLKKKMYPFQYENNKDYAIFIPDNQQQKIVFCTSFFSNTSLNFLSLQNLKNFIEPEIGKENKSLKMFIAYRTWLYANIPVKFHDKFMLFSSIVLYLLGVRQANDLDLYIDNLEETYQNKIVHLIETNKFDFIDYSVKNTKYWKKYWDTWLDEWSRSIGLLYFEEILCNPKYHFYYMGVKVISLECDIARRMIRNRPRSIADLIALNKLCSLNIKIPNIPSKKNVFYSLDELDENELKKIVEKGGIVNEKNKEVKIVENVNKTIFVNVIKKSLKERYGIFLSDIDIKKLVGMEPKIHKIRIKLK
jgi:hypothetical protein